MKDSLSPGIEIERARISHTGPASSGETVRIKARLTKREKRRVTFEVEVLSPRASISQGTHERAVVDLTRFAGPS